MKINDVLNVLKEGRGSYKYSCNVPSLNRKVIFNPINVAELKSMSKISLDEEDNSYFAATIAIILDLANEDLDMEQLTDFDRVSLMLDIKRNNQLGQDIYTTTCKCKTEYSFELDIDNIIKELANVPESKYITIEADGNKFKIEINMPSLTLLFKYREFIKQTATAVKKDNISDQELLKIELYFINYSPLLFIKSIEFNDEIIDNFNDKLSITDRDTLINALPGSTFVKISELLQNDKSFDIKDKIKTVTKCPNPKCNKENTYKPEIEDFFQI